MREGPLQIYVLEENDESPSASVSTCWDHYALPSATRRQYFPSSFFCCGISWLA